MTAYLAIGAIHEGELMKSLMRSAEAFPIHFATNIPMSRSQSSNSDGFDSSLSRAPMALIVEDEIPVAQFLASVLEEMGLRVVQANTAASAISQAHTSERFAVIFVDLALPDRSGLEVIAEVQLFQPTVPIVMSTGYGTMVERDVAEGSPYPRYLIKKPYTVDQVAELLSRLQLLPQ